MMRPAASPADDGSWLGFDGASGIADAVRARKLSAREVVSRSLSLAQARPELGAYWALDEEGAARAAAGIDRRVGRGEDPGPLAGVPVGVKDCIDVAGLPTTGGVLGPHSPSRSDAVAVARLRQAGAIPIGKTAMSQLGWSTQSQPPAFPTCLNPRYPSLSAGGSSSGSAASVAARITPIGLGGDVAGSVRIPAAFCGVIGFKPTLGTIPTGGVLKTVPSFDLIGILAESVRDCEVTYSVLSGVTDFARQRTQRAPLAAAILADLFAASDPEVTAACERTMHALKTRDIGLEVIRLEWHPEGFGRILAVELARAWGDAVQEDPNRFTEDVRASVAFGGQQPATAYELACTTLDQARRRLLRRFARYDVLLSPTVPHVAPLVGDERSVGESTQFTRIISALGWPAIAVPCGLDSAGRPVSLQLIATPPKLAQLFQMAVAVEDCVRALGGMIVFASRSAPSALLQAPTFAIEPPPADVR